MADSFPSFSLGLDLDLDSDPDQDQRDKEKDDEDEICVVDIEKKEEMLEPVSVLKRLRRGPPPPSVSHPPPVNVAPGLASTSGGWDGPKIRSRECPLLDDDIEEFSSQEDCSIQDLLSSKQNRSVCSSSKLSLCGQKVLSTQPANKMKAPTGTPSSTAAFSFNLETGSRNKKMLPRLTISPLRRIQFIDSDSDDPSPDEKKPTEDKDYDSGQKQMASITQVAANKGKNIDNKTTDSFMKNFSLKQNFSFTTPALDEFCEEYFSSMEEPIVGQVKECYPNITCSVVQDADNHLNGSESYNRNATSGVSYDADHNWNLPDPQPPSYHYFFNDDVMIRKLVSERLVNFTPLGAVPQRGDYQSEANTLDYMCQFAPQCGPGRDNVSGKMASNCKASKSRKRNQSSNLSKENSNPSGNWVDPSSRKNVVEKHVFTKEHSAGHWYTGQDGKKVYMSKSGQELRGSAAYRFYSKETGGGYMKRKKKAPAKKVKTKR